MAEIIKLEKAVTKITLEITLDEAQVINDAFYNVGGNPKKSRRRHVDSILECLRGCSELAMASRDVCVIDGALYFKDID